MKMTVGHLTKCAGLQANEETLVGRARLYWLVRHQMAEMLAMGIE